MFLSLLLATILLAASPQIAVSSQPEIHPDGDLPKAAEKQPVSSRHTVTAGGREITYTATAGHLPIMNNAGDTEANIFYMAYSIKPEPAGSRRPIMFIFNGGPGASSVWLHLGAVGPKRVRMLPDGSMPSPPFQLIENESTWLDLADLVFIDPVGTGYSRAVKPELTNNFTSVQGDIDSLGRFVRLFLSRQSRWDSPVFLVGESYGTFRAAGLAEHLLEHGIALNGIIMVSSILNFHTISFDNGNDLPYVLFLPSYAATAWYHGKLGPAQQGDLEKTLKDVESWAETEYLTALGKGDRLSQEERKMILDKLAGFTGLGKSYLDNRNLRIDARGFIRELLRDQRKTVGTMDSRFTAENLEPSANSGFDPTVATIKPPFTSVINHYLRNELGFQSDLEYFTLGGGIGHWDWQTKNSYADTSDNLRNAFAKNPHMKLFVASGCFDLATPHFAADYTLAHLGLTPPLRSNITVKRYKSGHMIYLENSSLIDLKKDVTEFIKKALQ